MEPGALTDRLETLRCARHALLCCQSVRRRQAQRRRQVGAVLTVAAGASPVTASLRLSFVTGAQHSADNNFVNKTIPSLMICKVARRWQGPGATVCDRRVSRPGLEYLHANAVDD
eukprot:TRINITY_DN3459_c0_g1_i8.p3 TRINITY_DN3459_c0_g1~~TRINITY_DN3459_c0_g1_i8.p3  ORF type:complete len:115 (-),score=5.44 TRINITY_DN3459_c0_g1_i8:1481-1825(-)